jgi:phosphoribosylformimino-5-aminoimidazole carboxamide ribotide isomerase
MLIVPSIDMLGGRCVRLLQGDFSQATFYEKDPVAVAREFEQAGAKRIHLVDLDAARGNNQSNRKKIRKIRRAVSCVLELGGGIRYEDDVEELLDMGIDRLVVGTILARNPERVETWVYKFGDVFLGGIDAENGRVRVAGWEDETSLDDVALAKTAKEIGLSGVVYTSIGRDGTMNGPDVERTNIIAREAGIPVVLSGGIGSEEHVRAAKEGAEAGVVGIITGKAVYEGQIDLRSIIAAYQDGDGDGW